MKHVSGHAVSPDGDLVVQRCMVCGFALVNVRCSETAVPDGQDNTLPTFEFGAIVEVEGRNPTSFAVVGQTASSDEIKSINGLCM